MRTIALVLSVVALVGAAVVPLPPTAPADGKAVFTDDAFPGLEFWLEPIVQDGSLVIVAVAHKASPSDYGFMLQGCGPGSWTSELFDPEGRGLGLPMQYVLMCLGRPPHVYHMDSWLNTTESWNGTQWQALDDEGLSHGWVITPGHYEFRFAFTAYAGRIAPPEPDPVPDDDGLQWRMTDPPVAPVLLGTAAEAEGWHSVTIVLPITVDAEAVVTAGVPFKAPLAHVV